MSRLNFSFNKPKPAVKPPISTSTLAFDNDEDEDSLLTKPEKTKKEHGAIAGLNQDLRGYTSFAEEAAARMTKEALDVDPSVFEYDAVYDDLKAAEREQHEAAEKDRHERKPQYMNKILAATEQRKRDFLIAQEKKYKKEREQEGEEFADKEKFVTSSYKRQQEELRKAEEEERLREENAKKGQGMASFYRKMLEEEEMKHDAAVEAAAKAAREGKHISPSAAAEVEVPREKKLADEARAINARLGVEAIVINDEGEVVDKRQLLKGGLNIVAKEKKERSVVHSGYQTEYEARRSAQQDKIKQREQESRLRQQRAAEEQYVVTKKRAAEEEVEKEEELKLRAKSKKTSEEVKGARERYLARKRAMTEGL